MHKYIKNNTQSSKIWLGQTVEAGSYFEITSDKGTYWANDDTVLMDISSGDALMAKTDDGETDISSINDAINFLKGNLPTQVEASESPFKTKTLPNGKKIFRRVHGVSAVVSGAPDNIDFVIPYANCKITGVEIINGSYGDKANFKVFDTPTGTISGVPNLILNQFGFDVYINEGYHKSESNYDADLIGDLKIRIEYDAITNDLLPKTVYVNFFLHEITD